MIGIDRLQTRSTRSTSASISQTSAAGAGAAASAAGAPHATEFKVVVTHSDVDDVKEPPHVKESSVGRSKSNRAR